MARGLWERLRKRLVACPKGQGGKRTNLKTAAPQADTGESPEEILFRMKFGKR